MFVDDPPTSSADGVLWAAVPLGEVVQVVGHEQEPPARREGRTAVATGRGAGRRGAGGRTRSRGRSPPREEPIRWRRPPRTPRPRRARQPAGRPCRPPRRRSRRPSPASPAWPTERRCGPQRWPGRGPDPARGPRPRREEEVGLAGPDQLGRIAAGVPRVGVHGAESRVARGRRVRDLGPGDRAPRRPLRRRTPPRRWPCPR